MAKVGLDRLFNASVEDLFDLCGVLFTLGVKAESAADADAMRVGNDARLPEDIPEHEVGDLSSDAGECEELVHGTGHLTAVVAHEDGRRLFNALRLGFVQSAGADECLYFGKLGIRNRAKRRKSSKELLGDDIDARVGALRTESRHDETQMCRFGRYFGS